MISSASEPAAGSDFLARSIDLYRDLSVVLSGQIADLKAGTAGDDAGSKVERALLAHRKCLQTVLDKEASLDKRSRSGGGTSIELDLDAARAEVIARLALRTDEA
jgi:hypothetical protein